MLDIASGWAGGQKRLLNTLQIQTNDNPLKKYCPKKQKRLLNTLQIQTRAFFIESSAQLGGRKGCWIPYKFRRKWISVLYCWRITGKGCWIPYKFRLKTLANPVAKFLCRKGCWIPYKFRPNLITSNNPHQPMQKRLLNTLQIQTQLLYHLRWARENAEKVAEYLTNSDCLGGRAASRRWYSWQKRLLNTLQIQTSPHGWQMCQPLSSRKGCWIPYKFRHS